MVFNWLIFGHGLTLACTMASSDSDMEFEELMLRMSDLSSNLTKEAKQFQPPKPPISFGERERSYKGQSLQDELNEIEKNLQQLMNVHKNIIPKQMDSLLKALEIERDLQRQANDQLQSQINALQAFHGTGQKTSSPIVDPSTTPSSSTEVTKVWVNTTIRTDLIWCARKHLLTRKGHAVGSKYCDKIGQEIVMSKDDDIGKCQTFECLQSANDCNAIAYFSHPEGNKRCQKYDCPPGACLTQFLGDADIINVQVQMWKFDYPSVAN